MYARRNSTRSPHVSGSRLDGISDDRIGHTGTRGARLHAPSRGRRSRSGQSARSPAEDGLPGARKRARDEGAPEAYLERVGDIAGIVAEKEYGDGTDPVVGIRVDRTRSSELKRATTTIDRRGTDLRALTREMHACDHDRHTAIGIGIARRLDETRAFDGTMKEFFQPAEEDGRGGLPMSNTGHLDDVDSLFAIHLGLGKETEKSSPVTRIRCLTRRSTSPPRKRPHTPEKNRTSVGTRFRRRLPRIKISTRFRVTRTGRLVSTWDRFDRRTR